MSNSTPGTATDHRPKASEHDTESDADVQKGAVEDDRPPTPGDHSGNTTLRGQLGHRTNIAGTNDQHDVQQEPQNDTDFPEPGSSPEHSGQHR
ncbi:MAG TPA: hypothetical protein VGD64_14445 [Acidisarcina sp.]